MTREEAGALAKTYLTGPRLEHSLSVAKLAESLAPNFGLDGRRLYLAGALHDLAKQISPERQRELADLVSQEDPRIPSSTIPALWHAPAAVWLLKTRHGFKDELVIQAILSHTTGSEEMSRFDECLYAADYLDPLRRFPGQAEVWDLLKENFDAGLKRICGQSVKRVIERGLPLDPRSVGYYNQLVARLSAPDHRAFSLELEGVVYAH